MRVLIVEPLKAPYEREIGNDLKSMQSVVGGYIQAIYPFDDEEIALICNEEGKLIGLAPNRRLGDDILCGVFYVVAEDDEGELVSLTPEQVEKYSEFFGTFESIPAEEVDHTVVFRFYPL